jgi:hypothetical protein
MSYEYKMQQLPPAIQASNAQQMNTVAASLLQNLVDQHAVDGWEFFRVDQFMVIEPTGCLNSGKEARVPYYVVTFRRNK